MEPELREMIDHIAQRTADMVIVGHLALCPFAKLEVEKRVRNLEVSYARLIGFMAGSGILGGAVGASIIKTITP